MSTPAISVIMLAYDSEAFGSELPLPGVLLPAGTIYFRAHSQTVIRDAYGSCDAWLCPSRSEGFGLPALEAMDCRTPVIATPAGAAPGLIAQGGGVLVPHEDPAAMASAIGRVLAASEPEWRRMSDRAHTVATRYTWADTTDRFEAALLQIVSRKSPLQLVDPVFA